MAKKRSLKPKPKTKPKSRFLFGALVYDNAESLPAPVLFEFTRIFLLFAGGDGLADFEKEIYPCTVVAVEGKRQKLLYEKGAVVIKRDPVKRIELMIRVTEAGKGDELFPEIKGKPPNVAVAYAIGSKEFCMAFLHFMSMKNKDSCGSTFVHYIRRLANSKRGDVLWYDSDKPDRFFDHRMDDWAALIRNQLATTSATG